MDLEQHFLGIKEEHIHTALALFHPVAVEDGEVLAYEGEVQDALVFLHEGEVILESGGFELTRLRGPHLFGEVALFTDHPRSATIIANGPVRVLLLVRELYQALADQLNPVAWRLEKIATEHLAKRVSNTYDRVIRVAPIEKLEINRRDDLSVGNPIPASPAKLAEKLRLLPEFDGAADDTLQKLATDLKAASFARGSALTVRGKVPTDVSILLSGAVDLIVYDELTKGTTIATLGPGAIFGEAALVAGDPSAASAMVTENATVVQLKANLFDVLLHLQTPVGSAIRVACIRSLADKLLQANAVLALQSILEERG